MAGNKKASPIVTVMARVTPRANRNYVTGAREDGVLLLRTNAPLVGGKANAACVELLSDFFGVGRRRITLLSGATGRDKRFALDGVTQTEIDERLRIFTHRIRFLLWKRLSITAPMIVPTLYTTSPF